MHPNEPPPKDLIRSVYRALCFLEMVGAQPGELSLKNLARRAGMNTATTYHIIRTLTWAQYLTRTEDNTYTLGPAILRRCMELQPNPKGELTVGYTDEEFATDDPKQAEARRNEREAQKSKGEQSGGKKGK